MSNKKAAAGAVVSVVGMTLLAIAVMYLFYTHTFIVNLCPTGKNLIDTAIGPMCYPSLNNTIIVDGKPYYNNVTVVNGSTQINFEVVGKEPLLSIWNQNISEPPKSYIFLTIPDTFSVHMQYVSNVTTDIIIMDNKNYIAWANKQPYTAVATYTGTSISFWFNESDGCAGYVAVITQPNGDAFSLVPHETALYAPSNHSTGACVP